MNTVVFESIATVSSARKAGPSSVIPSPTRYGPALSTLFPLFAFDTPLDIPVIGNGNPADVAGIIEDAANAVAAVKKPLLVMFMSGIHQVRIQHASNGVFG